MRTIRVDQAEQEEKDTDFQVLYSDAHGYPEGFQYIEGELQIVYNEEPQKKIFVSDLEKFRDALNKTIDLLKEQGGL